MTGFDFNMFQQLSAIGSNGGGGGEGPAAPTALKGAGVVLGVKMHDTMGLTGDSSGIHEKQLKVNDGFGIFAARKGNKIFEALKRDFEDLSQKNGSLVQHAEVGGGNIGVSGGHDHQGPPSAPTSFADRVSKGGSGGPSLN